MGVYKGRNNEYRNYKTEETSPMGPTVGLFCWKVFLLLGEMDERKGPRGMDLCIL